MEKPTFFADKFTFSHNQFMTAIITNFPIIIFTKIFFFYVKEQINLTLIFIDLPFSLHHINLICCVGIYK
jgi:hypothetical protein